MAHWDFWLFCYLSKPASMKPTTTGAWAWQNNCVSFYNQNKQLNQVTSLPLQNCSTTFLHVIGFTKSFLHFHFTRIVDQNRRISLFYSSHRSRPHFALTTYFSLWLYGVSVSVASFADVFGCKRDPSWHLRFLTCTVALLQCCLWSKQLLCTSWSVLYTFC